MTDQQDRSRPPLPRMPRYWYLIGYLIIVWTAFFAAFTTVMAINNGGSWLHAGFQLAAAAICISLWVRMFTKRRWWHR